MATPPSSEPPFGSDSGPPSGSRPDLPSEQPSEPTTDPDRHQELVERTSQGDEPALSELLAEHLPHIERFIRGKGSGACQPFESVSDVVQSVCRQALQDLAKGQFEYRGVSKFAAWLRKIAWFKIVDRVRKKKPHMGALPVDLAGDLLPPSQALAKKERIALACRAYELLSPNEREIIYLVLTLGLRHPEVAEQLGITEAASRQRHFRALARLRMKAKSLDTESNAG